MKNRFSVLFTVDSTALDECSAIQRFRVLNEGLQKLGVKTEIIYLGDYPIGSPRLFLAGNLPFFLKKAREYQFVHSAGLSVIAMGIAKTFGNYKIIYDVQGSTEEPRLGQTVGFSFRSSYQILAASLSLKAAEKKADYFVAVSEPLKEQLINHGIKKEKIDLIYNAVDTQLFKPVKRKNGDPFTVTYAGGYQKWQGIDNLLNAIEILKDKKINFKLMGFQERDRLVKQAIQARLGEIVELIDFQPRVENQQPLTFIQQIAQSDVLIIPRYTDPNNPIYSNPEYVRKTFGWLPTKFAEYISTGRPVIVTNLDSAASLVQEYDCGFVSNPNPESLAQAILEAKNSSSEQLDEKGINARKLAEREFDIKVIAKRYYNDLSMLV